MLFPGRFHRELNGGGPSALAPVAADAEFERADEQVRQARQPERDAEAAGQSQDDGGEAEEAEARGGPDGLQGIDSLLRVELQRFAAAVGVQVPC